MHLEALWEHIVGILEIEQFHSLHLLFFTLEIHQILLHFLQHHEQLLGDLEDLPLPQNCFDSLLVFFLHILDQCLATLILSILGLASRDL